MITGSGRSPGEGNGNPLDWRIPWTEESGNYSPEGSKELDMTEVTTNKANGGDGIPAELLQILKGDAVKVLHSICQQIWKTQQWPQDWNRSVSFQPKRKTMPNNAQTTSQLHSSHTLVK